MLAVLLCLACILQYKPGKFFSGGAQLLKAPGIHPEQLLLGAPHSAKQETCTYKEVFGVLAAVGASKATHDREGQMDVS